MAQVYAGEEKREFLRHTYEKPVRYKILKASQDRSKAVKFAEAVSKNLSASGILFSAKEMPRISSLLVLDLDYKVTRICQEIEENALVVGDKVFGKVVRIEDNGSGFYDIGVAFVKKFDDIANNIKDLMI